MPTTGERDLEGRRPQVLHKEAPQMSGGHAEPVRQPFHAVAVQGALADEAQRTGHEPRRTEPPVGAGRGFGSAAKTGAESRRLRRGGGGKVANVLVLRCAGRANRPAIDARAGDADEEAAIESRVPRPSRAVTGVLIQLHDPRD